MADYYAILKKAISALPKNTGEARRAIYEKARRALVAQLQNYDPPLSPSEITAQRLTLEEAVRKVEAEAARASLGLSPLGRSAQKPKETPKPEPRPERARETADAGVAAGEAGLEASPTPEAKPRPEIAEPVEPPKEVEPEVAPPLAAAPEIKEEVSAPVDVEKEPEPVKSEAPAAPVEEEKPAVAEEKGRGRSAFRDAVADAAKLGAASAEATRSARRALYREDIGDEEPEEEAPQRVEPVVGRRRKEKAKPAEPAAPPAEPKAGKAKAKAKPPRQDAGDVDVSVGRKSALDDGIVAEPMSMRGMWLLAVGVVVLVLIAVGAWIYAQRDTFFPSGPATTIEDTAESTPATDAPDAAEGESLAPKITDRLPGLGEVGPAEDARAVQTMRVTAPTEESTVDGQPADETAPVASDEAPATTEEPAATDEPAAPETTEEPAASDTGPQAAATPADEAPASTPDNGIAVGQRAILYEEGATAGSSGQAYKGQVVWQLGTEPAANGKGEDTVLTAKADIPSQDTTIEIKIRPNHDTSMPASHWIEVNFSLPNDFRGKGVGNVPGLIMKTTEEARGDALRGASARVLDNLFWIALSQDAEERKRNEELLTSRGWIDIPILYESGKRAILTLEKGTPGDKLVKQAFETWNKG